jgi:predicted RND superfamily exporter protein
MERQLNAVLNYPVWCVMASLTCVVFFVFQLLSLQIDPNVRLLDESHPARVMERELESRFTSTGPTIAVVLEPNSGSVYNTDTLARVKTLTERFENLNMASEVDTAKLEYYRIDADASERVDNILLDELQADDAQALSELREYLRRSWGSYAAIDEAFFSTLLLNIDPVTRVRSLSTVEDLVDIDDNLEVHPVMENVPVTAAEMLQLEQKIKLNPLIMGAFVSYDGKAANLQIELNIPSSNAKMISNVHLAIAEIVTQFESDHRISVGGKAVVTTALSHYMKKDNERFFPLVLVVVIVVLALSFRSLEGVYIPLAIAIASIVSTVGLMAWMGVKQNMITTMMPIFVMVTAVADSIHFLNFFYKTYASNGQLVRHAIATTYRRLFKALTFTTITTALGFLSLSYTDVAYVREFGFFASVGVVFAYLYTLLLIPALLMLKKKRGLKGTEKDAPSGAGPTPMFARGMASLTGIVPSLTGQYRLVTVLFLTVIVFASAYYAQRVKVDYEGVSHYPEASTMRLDDAAIKARFQGVVSLSVLLNGAENGAIYSKPVMEYINTLEERVLQHPNVGYVLSPNSYLKRMNQVLNNGKADEWPISMSSALAAQYYLLYDNSPNAFNPLLQYTGVFLQFLVT